MDIDIKKLSEEQTKLLEDFQKSGLSADDFLLKYLKGKGVADPDAVLKKIDSTLDGIDHHYEGIKKAKADGKDRKSYLRGICDEIFTKTDPEKAGKALNSVNNALEGKEDQGSSLNYDGFEAVTLIDNLDKAIINTTVSGINHEEK